MNIIAIIFVIFFGLYCVYSIVEEICSKFDHSYIPPVPLKPDAKIIKISSEKVTYVKNGAKYKTNVLFSDGFIFTTHKSNREDHIFTYNISVDNELAIEIAERALKAHAKAYNKQLKQ